MEKSGGTDIPVCQPRMYCALKNASSARTANASSGAFQRSLCPRDRGIYKYVVGIGGDKRRKRSKLAQKCHAVAGSRHIAGRFETR